SNSFSLFSSTFCTASRMFWFPKPVSPMANRGPDVAPAPERAPSARPSARGVRVVSIAYLLHPRRRLRAAFVSSGPFGRIETDAVREAMRHESVASPQLLARRVCRQHRGRVSPQMAVDLERRLEPYGLAAQTAGIRELVTVAYGRPRGRQPVAGFGYVYVYAKRTPQPRWA